MAFVSDMDLHTPCVYQV